MGVISLQGQALGGMSTTTSLFHSYVSGEEVIEGPLDPSAYAQSEDGGTGGARMAVMHASDANFITFDNPEVQFSQSLFEGNSIVAPLQPLPMTAEEKREKEEETQEGQERKQAEIYTVQSGDTIAGIASKFGVSVNTVLWANGLSSNDTIKAGDHITILPTDGVLHAVSSGDTVLAIANRYNADAKDVVAYNGLSDSSRLSIGQKLIVPDGKMPVPKRAPSVAGTDTRIAREANTGDAPTPPPADSTGRGWVWPTTTRNISQYFRWGHTGIDIPNRSRPPVFAAQGGTVEFAGWLGAYGNLIIINHGGGLTTYYAHNDKHYVSKGQRVEKGQAIAQMGSTGRSTGPHVHFEVRRNGQPINPLGMY